MSAFRNKTETTELISPMEETPVLFTGAFLHRGGNSLGRIPGFKGMIDCEVELF